MNEDQVIMGKIEGFCSQLQEHHLVNVRVFVTRKEGTNCKAINRGNGDFYSILGAVKEWIVEQDERTKLSVRNENAEPKEGQF